MINSSAIKTTFLKINDPTLQPGHVNQRVPVSESLTQLHRDQLQKFAQYLIAEMPKEVRPENFALFR